MTVQLGNVVLNDHLRLRGIETAPGLLVNASVSFDGTIDLVTMAPQGGRSLTLEGLRNGNRVEGYFTLEQIDAIRSIQEAGQETTLVHDRGTFTVIVVGGFGTMTPVFDYRNPTASTRYVGAINLLEV